MVCDWVWGRGASNAVHAFEALLQSKEACWEGSSVTEWNYSFPKWNSMRFAQVSRQAGSAASRSVANQATSLLSSVGLPPQPFSQAQPLLLTPSQVFNAAKADLPRSVAAGVSDVSRAPRDSQVQAVRINRAVAGLYSLMDKRCIPPM